MYKKKFLISGKHLSISDLKSQKNDGLQCVIDFIERFTDASKSIFISTSGSTGQPKKIEIKKEHLISSAQKTIEFLDLKNGDKVLHCLPVDKIAGIMMFVRWWVGELDLYLTKPNSSPMANDIGKYHFAAMVPFQVASDLNAIHRIEKLIIGGGAINRELEEQLSAHTNTIYHTYGMTETISHVAMRKVGNENMFQGLTGVSFSVNKDSCLIINAPHIDVTNLQTNDVVELVGVQSFVWKGRFDNVVNSGGIKLYPEEIEKKININEAFFLCSMDDAKLGSKLIILIETTTEENWNKYFTKLSKYERPKEVFLLANFNRTTTGKIKRQETFNILQEKYPT